MNTENHRFWQHDAAYEQAVSFLERTPFIDTHNDLPLVIRSSAAQGNVKDFRLDEDLEGRDTDIPKMQRGQVSAQIWAAFPALELGPTEITTLQQIEIAWDIAETHPEHFIQATKADDLLKAKEQNKIASYIAVEGSAGLANDLMILKSWYRLGVRLLTLCHNETLDWVDSATDAPISGGLSAFGKAVVRKCNELGIIVDCAHVDQNVMNQVLDISTAPVVFSHSNAYTLSDHPRNVPDDVLDRVPQNGGMVMATFVPYFLSQASRDWYRDNIHDQYGKASIPFDTNPEQSFSAPTVSEMVSDMEKTAGSSWISGDLFDLVDHIDYLAKRIGPQHVGIGSDFYGGPMPGGLETADCYPHIFAELIRRGWSESDLSLIAYENFLRVFRAVEEIRK